AGRRAPPLPAFPLDLLHGEGLARALHRPVPPLHDAHGGAMTTPFRISLVAAAAALLFLLLFLELIRRRRRPEGYAILWLVTAGTILVLSVWRSALGELSELVGIAYPP